MTLIPDENPGKMVLWKKTRKNGPRQKNSPEQWSLEKWCQKNGPRKNSILEILCNS